MKQGNMTKRTLFLVIALVISGLALTFFTYRLITKDLHLKNQLIREGEAIDDSIHTLSEGKLYQIVVMDQTKNHLEGLDRQLEKIKTKSKEIPEKHTKEVVERVNKVEEERADLYGLVTIYQLQQTLFEAEILTESGIDLTVKIKDEVDEQQIESVANQIEQVDQVNPSMTETAEVLAFATEQILTKESVEKWLAKNKKSYTDKNYRALKKMVEQVVPESVQALYKEDLTTFKRTLERQKEAEKQRQNTTHITLDRKSENTENTVEPNAPTNSEEPAISSPSPETPFDTSPRTDGFNFKGYHFDLSSFSGVGAVPQWTPYIYQWSDDPSHYLVEKASSAGSAIWNIGIGDTVVIHGQTYTVFHVMRYVANDDNAYGVLKSQGATVTWQTCETADPNSALAIWFAH
ncbi:hypothetical protein ACYSNO_03545 [Enterococcus sp. LJL98]